MVSSAHFIHSIAPVLETVPTLRLRKDIWTHFPVCLIKMPHHPDGRDRYSVQWHQKNLEAWCQKIPHYETLVRIRLLKSLLASERWTVEPPTLPGDLAIIAMRFSEEERQFDKLPDLRAESIELTTVDDIKNYFPICWKTQKNQHTLEFHNTFVRALAKKYSVDELDIRATTLNRLIPALTQKGWVVTMSNKVSSTEICSIHK